MEWEERLIHPPQQQLKEQKTARKKLEEQLSKTETLVGNVPGGTKVSSAVIGKSTTFKISTFDGTAPWELYHKQFEAAAAHNQWSNAKKTVAPIVHLKRVAQRVLTVLPRSDTIEYVSLVNCLEKRFEQKHLALVKRRELKNRTQKCGEGLQDYAQTSDASPKRHTQARIQILWSATVERFINGIQGWKVQSLVHMHSCKNVTSVVKVSKKFGINMYRYF